MAILYIITTFNPTWEHNKSWPPQMLASDWLKNQADKFYRFEKEEKSIRIFYFKDEEELQSYINSNRLTDPALLAAVKEWHSTYNITLTEQWIELPNYNPKIPGLFG